MSRNWYEITEVTNVLRTIPSRVPHQDMVRARYDQLDLARGIAIALMFLSHTVMALNTFDMLPAHGLVPIHAFTKFSSTLFILVFGVTLALFYVPHCGTEAWSKKRNRLLWRALMVLVWYKILTVVQMFETYPQKAIVSRLLFENFTDFAEVLNFYWLAILWIALVLPLWVRLHWSWQFVVVILMAASGMWLTHHFDFWGNWQLRAMLVEKPGAYCFGQFQRGALALFAVSAAALCFADGEYGRRRYILGAMMLALGLVCAFFFLHITRESAAARQQVLLAIAKNFGKHPPNLHFSLYSMAGACVILGVSLMLPRIVIKPLVLIRWIGRESFFCFNYHLILIFVGYRYLFGMRWNVTYAQTLWLFALVLVSAALLAPINGRIKKKGVLWRWLLP